jgi:hypothetical protein
MMDWRLPLSVVVGIHVSLVSRGECLIIAPQYSRTSAATS